MSLKETQNTYEQRFNCMICMCPRLQMVYGTCQHRICAECLYNSDNIRRPSMDRCPTCQKDEAFPLCKPDIPEDNIESQRCLGVRICTNSGCKMELWEWEIEEHLRLCPNRQIKHTSERRRKSQPEKDAKKMKIPDVVVRVTRSRTFNLPGIRPKLRRRSVINLAE